MEEIVVVDTRLGKLKGRTMISALDNKKYYSFRGIPYGKPPIGDLRFKAPQPFGGWEGVREALEDGHSTKQWKMLQLPGMDPNIDTEGDEDCLYLGVYINELPGRTNSAKPVMVHIHGGGFAGGSGDSKFAGPDYFMGEDIVLVSFNYRCGAFGFLSLENEEVPGNAGLKDQTLVLKWVQDNIDSFGGDPNNVTIFGISAGGASVHYHIVSPLSKGLFHRAIIQSGFCQNPWALQQSPKKVTLKLAKRLGCNSDNPHEILEFLRTVSGDEIVRVSKDFVKDEEYLMLLGMVFSPCVEVAGSEKFLPDTPTNLMKRGEYNQVPTILGVCENEGSVFTFFIGMYQMSLEMLPNAINSKPELLVPLSFEVKSGTPEQKQIQQEIQEFYFKGENLSLNDMDSILKFESDYLFNIGLGETRKYLLKNSTAPVFTYLFTNHSGHCFCKLFAAMLGPNSTGISNTGTCHGADCLYLLRADIGLPMPEVTGDFKDAVLKHIKIWTTFASLGNPNMNGLGVKWDRDSQSRPCYMDIGTVWAMREGVPFSERIDFWQRLSEKYCKD